MKEKLRQLAHRQPFQPLVIHLTDGRQLDVPHPDFLSFGRAPHSPLIFVVDDRDLQHMIDENQISDVVSAARF